MNSPRTAVLLVEDSAVDAALVKGLLRHGGSEQFAVSEVTTLAEALRCLNQSERGHDARRSSALSKPERDRCRRPGFDLARLDGVGNAPADGGAEYAGADCGAHGSR